MIWLVVSAGFHAGLLALALCRRSELFAKRLSGAGNAMLIGLLTALLTIDLLAFVVRLVDHHVN